MTFPKSFQFSGNQGINSGFNSSASGNSSVSIGQNSNASGAQSTSLGESTTSSAIGSSAIGSGANATATNSTAIGKNSSSNSSQAVIGSGAMALGGSYASGTDSFAAAVANNTSTYGAQGATSVAIGNIALASTTNSIAIGNNSIASGSQAVAVGPTSTASGFNSAAFGYSGTASGQNSFCIGNSYTVSAKNAIGVGNYGSNIIIGKYSYSAYYNNSRGDTQSGLFILTTTATAASTTYYLTTDALTIGTANQVNVPISSCYAFDGIVVARQQTAGGTNAAGWSVTGVARREATGNIVLVGTPLVTSIGGVVPTGWTLAVAADTTNQAIQFTFNMGVTAMNIRVVGTIRTAELTYA